MAVFSNVGVLQIGFGNGVMMVRLIFLMMEMTEANYGMWCRWCWRL